MVNLIKNELGQVVSEYVYDDNGKLIQHKSYFLNKVHLLQIFEDGNLIKKIEFNEKEQIIYIVKLLKNKIITQTIFIYQKSKIEEISYDYNEDGYSYRNRKTEHWDSSIHLNEKNEVIFKRIDYINKE